MVSVSESLTRLSQEITVLSKNRNHSPHIQTQLVAVSKGVALEDILEAYRWGQRCFAENKLQELETKKAQLPEDIEWHFIGHLQSNKVQRVVRAVNMIQSVDSLKVLRLISSEADSLGMLVKILLQVNITRKKEQYGFIEEQVSVAVALANELPGIQLEGFMMIGPQGGSDLEMHQAFSRFREQALVWDLSADQSQGKLSMGMSSDYKIAIQEGSRCIRLGTAIFGERQKNEKSV